MVVPIKEEESQDKPHRDAISSQIVSNYPREASCLRDVRPSFDCSFHTLVYVKLKIEVVRIRSLGLGYFVEEVVE